MNTFLAQHPHTVLGRFCFQFFGRAQVRDQGEVYYHAIFFGQFPLQLANSFNKGQAFDIAHGTADFGDDNVVAILTEQQHAALDFVGDMRYHLHGFTEISAFALFVYNGLVYAPSGNVVGLRSENAEEALIVAEVEVGFGAIFRYITFAVLIGIERAGIHIDIGVEFLDRDFEAPRLQEFSQRSCNNAFTER